MHLDHHLKLSMLGGWVRFCSFSEFVLPSHFLWSTVLTSSLRGSFRQAIQADNRLNAHRGYVLKQRCGDWCFEMGSATKISCPNVWKMYEHIWPLLWLGGPLVGLVTQAAFFATCSDLDLVSRFGLLRETSGPSRGCPCNLAVIADLSANIYPQSNDMYGTMETDLFGRLLSKIWKLHLFTKAFKYGVPYYLGPVGLPRYVYRYGTLVVNPLGAKCWAT